MTRHVLIIDDNPQDREAITAALRGDTQVRHTFEEATTGAEALTALEVAPERFHLIILDYRLPDMNAEQLLRKLGVPEKLPPVPVVLLTGSISPEFASSVLTRGVQDFFTKSAIRTDILSRISLNAIKRYELMSELMESERRAEDARVQAEQANRAKSQFLTTISHELRTPLTAILGFTELLHRDLSSKLTEDHGEMLEMVIQSGNHLADLLNDLIDIAKVEAGTLNLEPQPHDVVKLLASTCDLLSLRAAEHGLRLRYHIGAGVPQLVCVDPIRVRQILVNLLGNAIKFTEVGTIDCHLSYDSPKEELQVCVVDTGCGISDSLVPNLFEPFVQGEQKGATGANGAGLGLAISHRLAGMMGGSLQLESTSTAGTTFTLRIPAAQCVPHDLNHSIPAVPLWARDEVPGLDLSGRRVLLAEDTRANQLLMRRLLEEVGAEVDLAANGQDAVDQIRDSVNGGAFDLVLMDIQMPVLDGLEATRQLRNLGCDLPIVAITAAALKGDRDRCLMAGCDEVITKPIDIDSMHRVLSRALDGNARQR